MKPEEAVAIAKMNDNEMMAAQELYCKVVDFYLGDKEKANLWFEHPNADFDNLPPKQYLINGKIDKLRYYVEKHFNMNIH